MKRLVLGPALVGLIVLALGGPAAAQPQAEVARLLRVEWEPLTQEWTRPRLAGHVYNDSTYRIGSVRLRIEILDPVSQQATSEQLAWIYVNVPARSRAAFSVPRPRGEAFRITVESFVLIAVERDEQTP
jgi:hypothetical protein